MAARARVPRIAIGVVVALLLGTVGLLAYSAGVRSAERQCSRDVNALRLVADSLFRVYDRQGAFPRPGTHPYEMHGLTVSSTSDTTVAYYAGVDAAHQLTLHLLPRGRLGVSRR